MRRSETRTTTNFNSEVNREMRERTIFFFAAGITLLLAGGVVACNSHGPRIDADAAEIPSATVAVAARGNIAHVLSLAGQFQPYQVVDVHPKVTGFMSKINVDIGDRVHKGEVLAVLEVPELNAQLQGTVFQMQQTKDDLLRAQHEIKRAEALHAAVHSDYERLLETSKAQPGLIAQQELDDAQGKDLSSEAQVDAAKAAASAAEQGAEVAHSDNSRVQALKNYTNVVAPLDGVIVWRYADTGALIQSGENSNQQDIPIVRLSESGLLRLRMPIPEDDIRYVHIGDPLQIRVDAIGRSFTGKVARFTRDVSFETRTMETEVDVKNEDLSIAPGMYANAELQLAHADNVTTIPVEALVLRGNQNTVYLLDANNRVHVREVEVGLRGSKLAEIKSGLQPSDHVILGGQDQYTEGEQVRPILTQTPASEQVREAGSTIDMKAEQEEGNGGTK
ncbi:MAG: efflux RND transporter periplasmic adaptor subunit [Terracidiphilus sp.]